jgi:hypothetical protein
LDGARNYLDYDLTDTLQQEHALGILRQAEHALTPARHVVNAYTDGTASPHAGRFAEVTARRASEHAFSAKSHVVLTSGRIAVARATALGDIAPDEKASKETLGRFHAIGQAYRLARIGDDQTKAANAIIVGSATEVAAGNNARMMWRMRTALTLGRTVGRGALAVAETAAQNRRNLWSRHTAWALGRTMSYEARHLGAVWSTLRRGRQHYSSREAAHGFSANLLEI